MTKEKLSEKELVEKLRGLCYYSTENTEVERSTDEIYIIRDGKVILSPEYIRKTIGKYYHAIKPD